MTTKKKIKLRDLEEHDRIKRDSAVRELEMEVDAVCGFPYSMQFFQDCRTYGVDEAILYVRNQKEFGEESADVLQARWDKIKERLI